MNDIIYSLIGDSCLISFPDNSCCPGGSTTNTTPSMSITSTNLSNSYTIGSSETSKTVSLINIATSIGNSSYIKADSVSVVTTFNGVNTTIATGLAVGSSISLNKTLTLPVGTTSISLKFIGTDGNTYSSSNSFSIKVSLESAVLYTYYGSSATAATVDTLASATKSSASEIDGVAFNNLVFYIAVPSTKSIIIDNAQFHGDYIYNPDAGYNNSKLKTSVVTMNGVSYTLYNFVYFVTQAFTLNITIK